jgi:hypothetical protein
MSTQRGVRSMVQVWKRGKNGISNLSPSWQVCTGKLVVGISAHEQ